MAHARPAAWRTVPGLAGRRLILARGLRIGYQAGVPRPDPHLPVPGAYVEEAGVLVREGGGFSLRRDTGGLIALDLPRVPVDRIEKRVRIAGTALPGGVIEVEAIGPA